MNFKQSIEDHLTNYKQNILGISGCGFYANREYGHILPCGTWYSNYMCEAALEASKKIKKHKGWYHLNSSQTMCLNFFAPLVMTTAKGYEHLNWFLEHFLHIPKIQIQEFGFEQSYKSGKQSTEFDFWCRDNQNRNYFFEIKYTEEGIASSGGGKNPEKTFHEIYEPLVRKSKNLSFCLENDNWKIFMNQHYQAYRNMVMASEENNSYSFFVTMKSDEKTTRDYNSAISEIVCHNPGNEPKNIVHLFWEDIVLQTIVHFSQKDSSDKWKTPEMQGYYREFARKYLLDN